MRFQLNNTAENIFILGAGSSIDYGLPTWNELSSLISERLSRESEGIYSYKDEILSWVSMVQDARKYQTIDECIKEESISNEYHSNGHKIENEIFFVMKDIFKEKYKKRNDGWINILNQYFLENPTEELEHKIAFINYNYDNVLEDNLLSFTHLPDKQRIFTYRNRLDSLSEVSVPCLYPHGKFFSKDEIGIDNHVDAHVETMKTGVGDYIDAVSCYESDTHFVQKYPPHKGMKLYILGLGGGLEINLSNVTFSTLISEIHITIKDSQIQEKIISFLSKRYELTRNEIHVYKTCDDLINKCFCIP